MIEEPTSVEQTGLVVLTRGELVFAQQGSEAILAKLQQDGLVLEFPVEIEVRIVPACDPDLHVAATLEQFTAALLGLA